MLTHGIHATMAKERKSSLSMELRKKAGLSQTAVAAALGLTEISVRKWELGIHEPRLKLWQTQKLVEMYECDLKDLVVAFAPLPTDESQANQQQLIESHSKISVTN
jgi:transcriptional regulator with XRE-family HTH domain